jgi:AraC-like DNA-binding protein
MGGVRVIVAAAAARGVDVAQLLATVDLTPASLADPEGWIDEAAERTLGEEAARRLGDPVFGLHVGEGLVGSEVPEVLYHAARVSPTVGEALRRLARYFAVFHRRARVRLEDDGPIARFVKDADPSRPPLSPHGAMAMMSNTVLRLGHLLGAPFPLREVWFVHARPAAIDEYTRIFRAAVRFGQPCDALFLERAQLDRPLPTRAPTLLKVLEGHLERVAGRDDGDFMDRVRAQVSGHLRDPSLGVPQTARRLGVSPRTLQRRLQSAGCSFQAMVDDVRRDLALRHLGEGRLPVGEIALLLGFAELRPFYRAFKRWTGSTPGQHRARA